MKKEMNSKLFGNMYMIDMKINILFNFTVAGNTQNSASMTILPMPRMPRNRLLWRQ